MLKQKLNIGNLWRRIRQSLLVSTHNIYAFPTKLLRGTGDFHFNLKDR